MLFIFKITVLQARRIHGRREPSQHFIAHSRKCQFKKRSIFNSNLILLSNPMLETPIHAIYCGPYIMLLLNNYCEDNTGNVPACTEQDTDAGDYNANRL